MRHARALAIMATAAALTTFVAVPIATAPLAAAASSAPVVTGLSVTHGGTWGDDLITIHGRNLAGSGGRAFSNVRFGKYVADGAWASSPTTVQAYTPAIANRRTTVDVRVVLADGTTSATHHADHFTFVVPTVNTPANGHWSATKSQQVARTMMGRAGRVDAEPVARNVGHWTPAMGRSAVHRATRWLGLPYTFAGGTYSAPSYGVCGGDGRITTFACKVWGFDCSGLSLYAWGKYLHLDHFAATQQHQAGTFHPTVAELQPGDLLFWAYGGSIGHVAIYAGGGRIVQAPQTGWPVGYDSLSRVTSWSSYYGATRPMSRGTAITPPTVTSMSRTRSTLAGGAVMTLHGTHFDTTTEVLVGGVATRNFRAVSASTLRVRLPAHGSGAAEVRVVNAWGVSAVNHHAVITYIAAPTVASVSPAGSSSAGGGTVTLRGAHFVAGAIVRFGGATAPSVHVINSHTMSVVVPGHAPGPVGVTVVTPYGRSGRTTFTYTG